jgi:isoleucyl-tRNA synthetase
VVLGHILAEDGRKMSKHLGNILLPMPLMDEHGADALRWFMACSGSPLAARRMGHTALSEIVRKVLLTYWNTVAFQSLYARAAEFVPGETPAPPVAERPVLDRWALSEAHRLALDVESALEDFDTQRAGRLLAAYVDDLSNWYVRRSRRRFWKGDPAALATLHECLYVATLLMAPLIPFITERVWQDLFRTTSPELPDSVHLARWPKIDPAGVDHSLPGPMAIARRLVELGRAARAESGVRTRQPLRRALISSSSYHELGEELRAQVCDELNVGSLESLADAGGDLVDHSAKGNFRSLGQRFAQDTPKVAAAIAAADARVLAESLASGGTAVVDVDGRSVEVGPDDVIVAERPREGWSVVNDQGETLALDLELDDALRRAGLAREIVRAVQEARKATLEITDRITLRWTGSDAASAALREHADQIADEVLAVSITEDETADDHGDDELGLRFSISKA